jgi:hypothetical protein
LPSTTADWAKANKPLVDRRHKHSVDPVWIGRGCHLSITRPGYNIEEKPESIAAYDDDVDSAWKELL